MSAGIDNDSFGAESERTLQKLMNRLVDTREGFEKMVEEATEDFRPVAREFRDLHARQTEKLREALADRGVDLSEDGSFMRKVNETVVATRAFLDDIDEDVLAQVRSGERHVLNAYDEAIRKVGNGGLVALLTEMRDEPRDRVERTCETG